MKKFKTVDVALYIFILTGLGYFITFTYNSGYYKYYLIPLSFIDFSIYSITKTIVTLMIFVSSFLVFVLFFLDKTDAKEFLKILKLNKIVAKLTFSIQFICLAILFIIFIMATKEPDKRFIIIYIWLGLIISCIYLYIKAYKKATLIMGTIILLLTPYTLGIMNAATQTDFYVINNHEEYLVITLNDENLIAAKYDKESNAIYPEFKVISIKRLEKNENELELIKINRPTIIQPMIEKTP